MLREKLVPTNLFIIRDSPGKMSTSITARRKLIPETWKRPVHENALSGERDRWGGVYLIFPLAGALKSCQHQEVARENKIKTGY